MDKLELAEWCEKTKGPDAQADYFIHALVMGWRVPDDVHCFSWCVGENYQFGHPDDFNRAIYISESELPNYTASIDAALTLAGEVQGLDLGQKMDDRWTCVLSTSLTDAESEAATPALALCAAALRARAEGGKS
jgi:hypothetical protein